MAAKRPRFRMPKTPSELETERTAIRPDDGRITKVSKVLANFRWVYMPFGLLALIAVGVHAAADALDDRLLWMVDHVDSAFDAVVGAWGPTSGAVNWIGLSERVWLARGMTLVWELFVDLVLALPALGYHERAIREVRLLDFALHPDRTSRFKLLWDRFKKTPTTLRIVRPFASAAVVVAGACAVARMVQGQAYLSGRLLLGDSAAGVLARIGAVAVLGAVLYSLGWRAVLRNLEHADELSREPGLTPNKALFHGLWGSLAVLPVAVAALWDASPLLSFFR